MKISNKDTIIIDGGATFEGTLSQFRDCFFTNANYNTIKKWCETEMDGSTFEIRKNEN